MRDFELGREWIMAQPHQTKRGISISAEQGATLVVGQADDRARQAQSQLLLASRHSSLRLAIFECRDPNQLAQHKDGARMRHWCKPKPRVIEGGKADRPLRPDASQSRIRWNFWPLAAMLVSALLWAGIFWAVYVFS
ncbi:hypothetical protein [Bradyrhizobium neotropicale]|uniref:hypothetical protein n=1 Tax=Bradyrhizobium neotropicale TaxID=1497615 RepID=UPI001AD7061A|nr:hypothetical protein [Bradyrhizobium neotropicale]MBO4227552.1 hypothetical protein [Bradyrhizobium neotropicale]